MKLLRLIMIDCWGTILVHNPCWDDVILETIAAFLYDRHRIEGEAVARAFREEAEEFRSALVKRHITHQTGERISFLVDRLEATLRPEERTHLSGLIERCIARPTPDCVPGCETFLRRMKGVSVPLSLVCNTGWFSGRVITSALERLEITGFLEHLIFSDTFGAAKPARSIFDYALGLSGCAPNEAVHIGDQYETDVLGAIHAEVYPIQLVLGDRDSKQRGYYCLSSYERIHEHLCEQFRW
jgi:FMN phosphatase YigB (HAD superfamily)